MWSLDVNWGVKKTQQRHCCIFNDALKVYMIHLIVDPTTKGLQSQHQRMASHHSVHVLGYVHHLHHTCIMPNVHLIR